MVFTDFMSGQSCRMQIQKVSSFVRLSAKKRVIRAILMYMSVYNVNVTVGWENVHAAIVIAVPGAIHIIRAVMPRPNAWIPSCFQSALIV
jgi:hypothetical protein